MPIYEFYCQMEHTSEEWHEMSNIPATTTCQVCGQVAKRIPFPRRVMVNKGIKSRVYVQWTGDPNKCPADLRNTIMKQDMPKDRDFYRHPEEIHGSESERHRQRIIKQGLDRRKEKGVKYKIGSTVGMGE